jgi:microcystin-dependent protein
MTSVLRKTSAFTAHAKPTVGDTKTSFVTDDHLGWLRCDGRELSKADFGILFGVIGYTFGGSGNKFNLPDAQGRVVGHVGSSRIVDASFNYVVGDLSGQDQVTLTVPQLAEHSHTGTTSTNGNHIHTGSTSTDGLHNHATNSNAPNIGLVQRTGGDTATEFDSTSGELDLKNAANLVINSDGSHSHTLNIVANGDHNHTFTTQTTGENVPVSVMQATIFMGNLFIYSGIPPYGVWPYTTGTNIY